MATHRVEQGRQETAPWDEVFFGFDPCAHTEVSANTIIGPRSLRLRHVVDREELAHIGQHAEQPDDEEGALPSSPPAANVL
jgi:hypothetical protein